VWPSKCEAVNSNPSMDKGGKKANNMVKRWLEFLLIELYKEKNFLKPRWHFFCSLGRELGEGRKWLAKKTYTLAFGFPPFCLILSLPPKFTSLLILTKAHLLGVIPQCISDAMYENLPF
jgi:hypothetical protein